MSGNSLQLTKKMGVASDLQGVVRSMKALAASSLGQYERAVIALDGYALAVHQGLGACLRLEHLGSVRKSSLLATSKIAGSAILIVFGSDQGLVGSFNENLAQTVDVAMATLASCDTQAWAVGERMVSALSLRAGLVVRTFDSAGSINAVTDLVNHLLVEIAKVRERDPGVVVRIFHHRPVLGSGYRPQVTRLLPFDAAWHDDLVSAAWPGHLVPEMIDGSTRVLAALIDAYLFISLFRACVESLASENASRLSAMQRAEKNIEGLLDGLGRRLHRLRQETIDEELFDVIAGFDGARPSSNQPRSAASTGAVPAA